MRNKSFIFCLAIFIFSFAGKALSQAMIIETFAGGGGSLGDGGPATSAQFSSNYGIAVDASNNVYVADWLHNRIRKIDAVTNVITTICNSTGASGSTGDGGLPAAAKLNGPTGVAVDAAGNIFIADAGNNKIRMISAVTGFISTIAGTGVAGFFGDGGPAAAAKLSNPRGICVDLSGNVFITDCDTMRVREITAPVTTGNINTVAGVGAPGGFSGDGGAATLAKLNAPRGVAVDGSGNIFIADMTNNRLREVTAATSFISTVAGIGGAGGWTCDNCPAAASKLNGPVGAGLDGSDNPVIADAVNNRVRRVIMSSGNIFTIAGSGAGGADNGDGGLATSARTNTPVGVVYLHMTNGSFLISDQGSNVIRIVRPDFTPKFTGGTSQTFTICENSGANSINALLSVTDSDLHQTQKWDVNRLPAPAHGGLSAFTTASVTNTSSYVVTPPGSLTYTPAIGYSGTDVFYVRDSDYTLGVSIDTINVIINPLPVVAAITGPTSVCQGSAIALTDVTSGGGWTSNNTSVASVDGSGNVTGVTAGSATITYSVSNSCGPTNVTYAVTVNPLPNAGAITGPTFVCMGSGISLTDASGGGVWTSSNTSFATVTGTGFVTSVSPGGLNIVYTVTNGCGVASTSYPISVVALPNAGSISGPTSVCVSATINLTDAVSGGLWSGTTGNTNVVGPAVTGVTAGTDIISYAFTNLCGSAYATYNVTINPLPVVGAINGPTGVCVGGTISLSDATGGVWSSTNTSIATIDAFGVVTGVSSGAVTIDNTVSNICGSITATYGINVITIPSAGTITGPASVCVGASINLTDAIAGGTWTSSNTSAIVSGTSGMVTGAVAGVDTIIYSVTYSCGSANTTYTVTINPLADPGTITGPSTACLGSSIVLTDATGGGVWSSSNTGVATVSGGAVNGIAIGTAGISYSVTNGCGTVSAIQSVTVSPIVAPKVTFTAVPGFNSCFAVPVTYTANPVNGGASPSYVWTVNGTATAVGASFSYTPADKDVIICTMTSSAPCLSTTVAADTVGVKVTPNVTPSVTISTGAYGDTVCVGTSTPFMATAVNGGLLPTYVWTINGVPGPAGSTLLYTPSNGDNISCTLSSSQFCALPASITSNTVTMTVMTSEIPDVTIWASPGSDVCQSTTVTFTANLLYGGVPPFIRWTKNGTNVATGLTYNYKPLSGDVVYCMLASSSTCLASTAYDSVFSNHITMSVVPDMPLTVAISGVAGNVVGKGENDIFTAVVTTVTPLTTYQWEVNGAKITGATNSTFIFNDASAGTAVVNCVVSSGDVCNNIGISNLVNVTITDVAVKQIQAANNDIVLIPNPNRGSFTVEGTMSVSTSDATIQVTDLMGQTVYSNIVATQNGKLNSQVNLGSELANGIYILHIISGDTHDIVRFSVSR
jgi:uncharacterized protein YjdB